VKTYDVAIAGAGLIGGAIARELTQAGLSVALFDRQQPGQEASRAGAGILSPAPESPAMIQMVPIGKASMALYPEFVRNLEEATGIAVGFRPNGTLQPLFSANAPEELSTIVALHHGLGLKAEALSAEDARELEPAVAADLEAAVLRPEEASVDNAELTRAVLGAARQSGADIWTGNAVVAISTQSGRCTGLACSNGERVSAGWTVVSAGCFSRSIAGVERYAAVQPAKGQMVSLRSDTAKIERVLWGQEVYLVPRNDGRILAGATVEYVGEDRSVTVDGIRKLLNRALELAPVLSEARIEQTWAGLRPDSADHLPIIGPTEIPGLVIATGHFRSGILLAPVTARLVREWITTMQVSVDWERFSPMRFASAEAARQA
jgi:glycine oxidase